jgi:hypothetical protein
MFDDYGDDFIHPSAELQQEDDIVITSGSISSKPQISAVLSIKQELIEDMEQDMEQSPTATPSLVSVKQQLKSDHANQEATTSSASDQQPPETPNNFVSSCMKTAANKVESFFRSHIH